METSDGIQILDSKTSPLHFDTDGEKMVFFHLNVKKANGLNHIKVSAKSGSHTAKYHVEIDVVNPNPITSKVMNKTLKKNQQITIDFSTFGVEGTNEAVLQLSSMPPIDFDRRLDYLIRYPHGCVEQTTSSVFPQLYLTDLFDLSSQKKDEIEANIRRGIKRLGFFQRPNGGLSYWIGEGSTNDWGSTYAGHFMIEAEKKRICTALRV